MKQTQYKPVIEVSEILKSKLSKKEILFKLWDWEKKLKSQPGSVIAASLADKYERKNFGQENGSLYSDRFYQNNFTKKYPILYKNFSQVEQVEYAKGHFDKKNITYTGLHRTDCIERIKIFCENFAELPEHSNDEMFLKKYGNLKEIGMYEKLKGLEKFLTQKIENFKAWHNKTKLPARYYLGEITPSSLREFEKAKSNLNYITLFEKTIAIENIEHWEGMYGECAHGLGKLKSVDRAVYVNGRRYPIKRFDKGFLLDVLIPILKPEKVQVPNELKSIQLEDHFCVTEVYAENRNYVIYVRQFFGLTYDYCIVDKQGVTFHADSIDELLPGLQKKKDAIEQNLKLKEIVSSGKDELISLSKLDSRDLKSFVERFKIKDHVKNKKVLKSVLTAKIKEQIYESSDCGYISGYWESGVPLLKELRTEFYANREKILKEEKIKVEQSVLSETWTIKKVQERFRFCEEGMKAFCRANKINPESQMNGQEILDKVKKNLVKNGSFKYELRILFPVSLENFF